MSALQGSEIPRNYQGNQAEGGGAQVATDKQEGWQRVQLLLRWLPVEIDREQ